METNSISLIISRNITDIETKRGGKEEEKKGEERKEERKKNTNSSLYSDNKE